MENEVSTEFDNELDLGFIDDAISSGEGMADTGSTESVSEAVDNANTADFTEMDIEPVEAMEKPAEIEAPAPVDFGFGEINFTGKGDKLKNEFTDLTKDERSLGEKAKGTIVETGKGLVDTGKAIVDTTVKDFKQGVPGASLINALGNAVQGVIAPDKKDVSINGKSYTYDNKDRGQKSVFNTLESLSTKVDEIEDFDDLLDIADAALQMNNAISSMNSADLIALGWGATSRGSNQRGMSKASEDLLAQLDARLTPEYLDTLSPEQIGQLTQSVVMNSTFSGLEKSKSLNSITDKLAGRPGVKEAIDAIKPEYDKALAAAKDKSNSKAAMDVVSNALIVASVAGGLYKAGMKGIANASAKYGATGLGENATSRAMFDMMNKMEKAEQVHAKYDTLLNNPTLSLLDPDAYKAAQKAVKAADREAKIAQRSFAAKSKIGSIADDLTYAPQMVENLDAARASALAEGNVEAAEVFGKSANLGKTINTLNAAAGATEVGKSKDSSKVEKVASGIGKAVRGATAVDLAGKAVKGAFNPDTAAEDVAAALNVELPEDIVEEIEKNKGRIYRGEPLEEKHETEIPGEDEKRKESTGFIGRALASGIWEAIQSKDASKIADALKDWREETKGKFDNVVNALVKGDFITAMKASKGTNLFNMIVAAIVGNAGVTGGENSFGVEETNEIEGNAPGAGSNPDKITAEDYERNSDKKSDYTGYNEGLKRSAYSDETKKKFKANVMRLYGKPLRERIKSYD